MKKRVLIAVHLGTFVNELFRVASLLRDSTHFEPVVIFPHYFSSLARDVTRFQQAGIPCLGADGKVIIANQGKQFHVFLPQGRRKNFIKGFVQHAGLLPLANQILRLTNMNERPFNNFILELLYLRSRIKFVRSVIRDQNIHLLILGGDTVHYDTGCFVRAAHDQGIRAAITPCTMSNAEEMAESYLPLKQYHLNTWFKRIVAKRYPRWTYTHRGQTLLRLPASRLLAQEILHLAPPHPWMALSGFADVIAAESEFMISYYTQDGIPRSQIELTGTLSDDLIADGLLHHIERRQMLVKELDLPIDRPILVSAIPPDQLYMVGGRPECEFSTYRELLEFWVQTLAAQTNYSIILSLHPSMNIHEFRWLESSHVRMSDRPIAALIPLGECFVASISTVIRWAIACGIPVINYDVYQLRYSDYVQAPGVITIETKRDFQSSLARFSNEPSWQKTVRTQQQAVAASWGKLDGQAQQRFLTLFERLTNAANS